MKYHNVPTFSLIECPSNDGAGQYILNVLSRQMPAVSPRKVILLDFDFVGDKLPVVFFVATVLSDIWRCRIDKKPCRLHLIKANLEAKVNILRKSRHRTAADALMENLKLA